MVSGGFRQSDVHSWDDGARIRTRGGTASQVTNVRRPARVSLQGGRLKAIGRIFEHSQSVGRKAHRPASGGEVPDTHFPNANGRFLLIVILLSSC